MTEQKDPLPFYYTKDISEFEGQRYFFINGTEPKVNKNIRTNIEAQKALNGEGTNPWLNDFTESELKSIFGKQNLDFIISVLKKEFDPKALDFDRFNEVLFLSVNVSSFAKGNFKKRFSKFNLHFFSILNLHVLIHRKEAKTNDSANIFDIALSKVSERVADAEEMFSEAKQEYERKEAEYNKLIEELEKSQAREQAAKREAEEAKRQLAETELNNSPKLFINSNVAAFPSSHNIQLATELLLKSTELLNSFQSDDSGGLFLSGENPQSPRIYIHSKHDEPDIFKVIKNKDALKDTLQDFDPEAACLNMLYGAKAACLADPREEFIYSYEDLCEDLGLNRKKIGNKEKIQKLLKWSGQPSQLLCIIPTVDKSGEWLELHKIWDIAPRLSRNSKRVSLRVRAGMWANYYLSQEPKADRKKRGLTRQISFISHDLLKAITKHVNTRPGAVSMMLWHLIKYRADGSKSKSVKVKTCMIKAYGQDKVKKALIDREARRGLWQEWSNDTLLMNDCGWSIDFMNAPSTHIPDWAEGSTVDAKPRGYLSEVLEHSIVITPPSEIVEELEKLKRPKIASQSKGSTLYLESKPPQKEISLSDDNLAQILKKTRKSRGLTQADLAQKLEISISMVKKLEGNKKKASHSLMKTVAQWVNSTS